MKFFNLVNRHNNGLKFYSTITTTPITIAQKFTLQPKIIINKPTTYILNKPTITKLINNNNNNDSNYNRLYTTSTTGAIKEYFEDLKENILNKVGNFESPNKVDRDYILNKGDLNYYFDKLPPTTSTTSTTTPTTKKSPLLVKQIPYSYNIHNTIIKDPYNWLQDINDVKVTEYIQLENQYKENFEKTQFKTLAKKIQSIFKKVYVDHPIDNEILNGYKFIMKNKILYRQRISDDKIQPLLQDGEIISGITIHLRDIINFKFSQDNSLFSFVVEVGSSEKKVCIIKNVSDYKAPVLDIIENVTTIEWGKGNDLFYTQPDEITRRTHKIFKRIINNQGGGIKNQSELMVHETNPTYFLDIVKSKDNQFLFYCSNSKVSTLIYYINLNENQVVTSESHKIMLSRSDGLEYYAEHNNDEFYIFANSNKGDLNIYKTKDTIENGSLSDLQLFLSSHEGSIIRDIDMYENYLVVVDLYKLKPRIRIFGKGDCNHFDSENVKIVEFPQNIIQISLGVNIDYHSSDTFSITYTTPTENITPATISLKDGRIKKLPGSKERGPLVINPDQFKTEIVWVPSKDDEKVKIPMSIVYNKDIQLSGDTPCILYGYGSYGNINELTHNLEDLFLLNAGFIIGKAHVRGGGELGRQWYRQGKLMNKKNTFSDYIDCVEYLFQNKYTSPQYLIGRGSSAGGMLMCNVALTHPNYFSGIISQVPFSDIITTMLDDSLPLTIHEYDEWGNPSNDPTTFNYIKDYDPYFLIDKLSSTSSSSSSMPNLYVTGSSNDFRVPFWQPLKWVAKLRNKLSSNTNTNQPIILLGINDDSGHFGPNERNLLIKKWSNEISFIFYSIKKSTNK